MLSGIGIWQLLIILVIVLLLFGTKRLKGLGGDLGGAIKGFKKAMGEEKAEDKAEETQQKRVEDETPKAPDATTGEAAKEQAPADKK